MRENPAEALKEMREIGRGAYGKVYVAFEKQSKKKVAVKHIKRSWETEKTQYL